MRANDKVGSEVSEWERRERREQGEGWRAEAEELGAAGGSGAAGGIPRRTRRRWGGGVGGVSLVLSLVRNPFPCNFVDARHLFWGQVRAGCAAGISTCRR